MTNENERNIQHSKGENKDKDGNEETESRSISEEIPAQSLDTEAIAQNVKQIRKALKANDSILYKGQNAAKWAKATVL